MTDFIEKMYDCESCPDCGGQLIVHTLLPDGDDFFDSDSITCLDCNFVSAVSVDPETGETWVQDPF